MLHLPDRCIFSAGHVLFRSVRIHPSASIHANINRHRIAVTSRLSDSQLPSSSVTSSTPHHIDFTASSEYRLLFYLTCPTHRCDRCLCFIRCRLIRPHYPVLSLPAHAVMPQTKKLTDRRQQNEVVSFFS